MIGMIFGEKKIHEFEMYIRGGTQLPDLVNVMLDGGLTHYGQIAFFLIK
jgi:hypothetical protein